jgi:predicted TIM-barrel fold metal-dependent hydrolase
MKVKFLSILAAYLFISACLGHSEGPTYNERNKHNIIRNFKIIDVHEHIQSRKKSYELVKAMGEQNIVRMILVGSPKEVLYPAEEDKTGFTDPEWNNNEILEISEQYQGMFFAFGTFSPNDNQLLERLKRFLKNGGAGLKLYNGHVDFYGKFKIKLDAPHLMKAYAYCEEKRIPIVFHANARLYWPELRNVLDKYPNLVVNLPHYCMSLIDLDRMRVIFESYPNVYSDISLGSYQFAYPALEYVSDRRQTYRAFLQEYKTRFLFATDMVLTDDAKFDVKYVSLMISGYRDFLEKRRYTNILIDEYLASIGKIKTKDNGYFDGLQLDVDTLRHIYEINPRRFLGQ